MRKAVLTALSVLLIAVPCFAALGRAMPAEGLSSASTRMRSRSIISIATRMVISDTEGRNVAE